MELVTKGDPKEIAALVVAIQERQMSVITRATSPLETIREAVHSAIGDIEQEKPS